MRDHGLPSPDQLDMRGALTERARANERGRQTLVCRGSAASASAASVLCCRWDSLLG